MKRARRIQRVAFFLSALGLSFLVYAGIELPRRALVAILAVLVALVGLPHGALDPLVARKAGLWKSISGVAGFMGAYLLLAAVAGLLWVWAPKFSLVAFLAYSAWHFSGDWRKWLSRGWRLCAGATVICAPSLLYPDLVAEYFSVLTGAEATSLVRVLQLLAFPALIGTIFLAARCLRTRPAVTAELAVLALSAVVLPPLVFFLLYFCSLHSPRHLIDTVRGMKPATAAATAAGLTLATVALGALFFVLSPSTQVDERLLRITFIGLAVLTVPHMILIEYFAARTGNEPAPETTPPSFENSSEMTL
ncbi:MAG: Brp/Blh family beta-carotene 15,15'-dioxygenase [Verrucomicrobiae bacterium]|jgi:beta-carotene 15,15'-dioxygenase|nr:Brp/Blh family beta-carotene 15,15'-dioxygenase [Verrucomicrobiae bacterium]MDF2378447.1 Brp/Blh family beta-carotene 15,15'-dioxygenase [Verrucomicrobiales bacterium]